MSHLTPEQAGRLGYSELVGLLRERNRPSGGIRSVHAVAVQACLDPSKRVLEIGCNTGFTSVNLALVSGCKVVGIDMNAHSLEEAQRYAAAMGVDSQTSFVRADATRMHFADGEFDLVWASNVTSFIDDKRAAVREYLRVLRGGGLLTVIPIYYRRTPPPRLVEDVGRALGSSLRAWSRDAWVDLFASTARAVGTPLELLFERRYRFLDRSHAVDDYCDAILARLADRKFAPDAAAVVGRRYREMMRLFNENLQYCGFSILLFQKRPLADEPELFLTTECRDDSPTGEAAPTATG
jgi:SAM-dependent methyltransferase